MAFGFKELLIILVVVLVLFGAGKLPKVMADVGKGIRGFKRGMNNQDDVDSDAEPGKITKAEKDAEKDV